MKKEERFELVYAVPDEDGNETVKTCYPRSVEKKNENIEKCNERGYRVVSCKKLYPFSTERNQHNFMLISNVCSNRMWNMDFGNEKFDGVERDRLADLKEKADELFLLPLPVAWLPWDKWKEANEISQQAIIHRQNACAESGRFDLIQYC